MEIRADSGQRRVGWEHGKGRAKRRQEQKITIPSPFKGEGRVRVRRAMVYKYKLLNSRSNKQKRRNLRRKSTKSEELAWRIVKNNHLGHKFRRQYAIGGFIVDFCCPELKLIVEIDGETHQNEAIYNQDIKREEYLKSLGFIVKRYAADYVLNNPESLAIDLKSFCDLISLSKTSPYPLL